MRRWSVGVIAVAVVMMATTVNPSGPARAAAFSPGSSGSGDPYFPLQGNGGYDVGHYDITFSYEPATRTMVGSTLISATATQDLSRFNVDFTGLTVRSVAVNGAAATFSAQGQELVVTPLAGLPSGHAFSLAIAYDGTPTHVIDPDGSPDGWIVTDDGAFVANSPQGAMTWFPGSHDLLDKATHTFRITVPDGTTAIANGALVAKTSSAGRTTFVWTSYEPMASYLSTATVGRFNMTKTRTPIGANYLAIDPNVAAQATGPVTQTLSIATGLAAMLGPYPFWVTGGVVDNARSVGYSLETQTKPLYHVLPNESLVVHELVHQWYGASVTPTTWRDIWLNEGFATYVGWMWAERTGGVTAGQQFDATYSRSADSSFWQVPPGDPGPVNLFHDAVYARSAMTLHALRTAVGGRRFSYILQTWAAEHRHGHGTTAQFVELAERISYRQLDDLFQRWLYQPGKPAFP